MALTKEERIKLDEMHDAVIRLEVRMCAKGGLCDEVADHNKKIDKINFRLTLLIGVLIGSGIIGSSAYGIVQLVS